MIIPETRRAQMDRIPRETLRGGKLESTTTFACRPIKPEIRDEVHRIDGGKNQHPVIRYCPLLLLHRLRGYAKRVYIPQVDRAASAPAGSSLIL
jgi:hypothetical protein